MHVCVCVCIYICVYLCIVYIERCIMRKCNWLTVMVAEKPYDLLEN